MNLNKKKPLFLNSGFFINGNILRLFLVFEFNIIVVVQCGF